MHAINCRSNRYDPADAITVREVLRDVMRSASFVPLYIGLFATSTNFVQSGPKSKLLYCGL